MAHAPLLPTYQDSGLRPKTVWTDPTIRKFQALKERLTLQEFGVDIKRAEFARALVWSSKLNEG